MSTAGGDRPHVLLVHDAYPDYVACLANALAERTPVTLLHTARLHARLAPALSDAPRTVVLPHRRLRDPRRLRGIVRADAVAASVGADLVHLQQSDDPVFTLAHLRAPRTVPRVLTVHDVSPHPGDRTAVPGGQVALRTRRGRIDRFVAHAEPLRVDLSRRWRVAQDRIDVLPHGELGTLYRRRAAPGPARPGTARVLFFGRVWPYKGLDRLVEAANRLAPARPGLVLTIAGTGEALGRYLRAVRPPLRLEVLDRFIPPEEVAALFEAATVVCLPYREASQSGVHALACGLGVPVVATAVGGLATAVRDGHDGLLVPPDDVDALAGALARVLDDAPFRATLSDGARDRCRRDLDWSGIADATLEVYARARREVRA